MEQTRTGILQRFGMMSPREQDEQKVIGEADRVWNYLSKSRQRAEYEWWLNQQFYQGEQYVSYNPAAKKVVQSQDAGDKITINKIAQNGRFVVAWLNRDHPQSKVLPGCYDDEAYIKAKKSEHLIDYYYATKELNKKTKQTTLDAYLTKVGFWKIVWDPDCEAPTSPTKSGVKRVKGDVEIYHVDPWELYWDPTAESVEEMRFIIHAVPRTIGEIRNNSHYMNTDKVKADSKLAASYMREAQIRAQIAGSSQFAPAGGDDSSTTIVREMYKREWVNGKKVWRIITTTSGGVLLRNEVRKEEYNPFEMYLADVQGSILDGGGPVRHLRSPQKALNQINSIIHQNARIMGKINWRIPRGANVNVIDDSVGQFLEFDPTPGGAPEQVTPSGLPAYMPNHREALEKYIDDIGGNHSASYGRSPGSKASGELVNRLQEGDSNNLALMRDNLDDFLSRAYKKILMTFRDNTLVDRQVRTKDQNALGEYDFVQITKDDIALDDEVVVRSGSNMPYSVQDKQEMYFNFAKEKFIDPKTLFKVLDMPDLDNALGSQQLDIERAIQENRDLMKKKPVPEPVKGEDQAVHIESHTQLVKSQQFRSAPLKVQQSVLDHIDKHYALSYQLAMVQASMNVEPIKRSEAIMYRPNNFSEMTPIERTQIFSKFGVQSDAAQIQQRGGLNVQDPAAAEQQAQAEDMQVMDGMPVMISIADNHKVHIETHLQLQETAAWAHVPEIVKMNHTRHIKQHENAMQSQNQMAGLMPTEGSDRPDQPQVLHGSQAKPVDQAAQSPDSPTPRPLAPQELLQHPEAVKNKLASEKLAQQKTLQAKKPKSKSKLKKSTSNI